MPIHAARQMLRKHRHFALPHSGERERGQERATPHAAVHADRLHDGERDLEWEEMLASALPRPEDGDELEGHWERRPVMLSY